MRTVRVGMAARLLKASDRGAGRLKVKRLQDRELERKEREAYERMPDDPTEFAVWDKVADL